MNIEIKINNSNKTKTDVLNYKVIMDTFTLRNIKIVSPESGYFKLTKEQFKQIIDIENHILQTLNVSEDIFKSSISLSNVYGTVFKIKGNKHLVNDQHYDLILSVSKVKVHKEYIKVSWKIHETTLSYISISDSDDNSIYSEAEAEPEPDPETIEHINENFAKKKEEYINVIKTEVSMYENLISKFYEFNTKLLNSSLYNIDDICESISETIRTRHK